MIPFQNKTCSTKTKNPRLSGDLPRALSYLQSGLSLTEAPSRRDEAARLRHRLGLVQWASGESEAAVEQLEKAAALLESRGAPGPSSCLQRPSKSELLAETYRVLQKVLVGLGRAEQALHWAERARRSRDAGGGMDEPAVHFSDIVDRQKGVVLYYRCVRFFFLC